jgi:hypothetical protein
MPPLAMTAASCSPPKFSAPRSDVLAQLVRNDEGREALAEPDRAQLAGLLTTVQGRPALFGSLWIQSQRDWPQPVPLISGDSHD